MSTHASEIEYESTIEADILHVTYKWTLKHWYLLAAYYNKGVYSPRFKIKGVDCECELYFGKDSGNHYYITLTPYFFTTFLFHSMWGKVSIVDENMKTLSKTFDISPETCIRYPAEKSDMTFSFSPGLSCLRNDTVILFVELDIATAIKVDPLSTNIWHSSMSNVACDKLKDMFEAGQFHDVTFNVQGQKLSAHKVVVAANSDVFRAMFDSNLKEQKGEVDIVDVDARVFKVFLKYFYTGKIEDIDAVVNELIVVANKYLVKDLAQLCKTYMMDNLRVDNAIQYFRTARLLQYSDLEIKAVAFVKANTKSLAVPEAVDLLYRDRNMMTQIFR